MTAEEKPQARKSDFADICRVCGERLGDFDHDAAGAPKCSACGAAGDVLFKEDIPQAQPLDGVLSPEMFDRTPPAVSNYVTCDAQIHSPELTEKRRPWPIEILIYPFTPSGMMIIGVTVFVPILINVIAGLLGPFGFILVIFGFFAKTIIFFSVFNYILQCIQTSGDGEFKSPELLQMGTDFGEIVSRILRTLAAYLVCWFPMLYYVTKDSGLLWMFIMIPAIPILSLSPYVTQNYTALLWLGLAGAYIFPMLLLSAVMFDGIAGFNPLTIIGSIFSTLLPYTVMVVILYGLGMSCWRLLEIASSDAFDKSLSHSVSSASIVIIFAKPLLLYLYMIMAHLLGRFHVRYEARLRWDV